MQAQLDHEETCWITALIIISYVIPDFKNRIILEITPQIGLV